MNPVLKAPRRSTFYHMYLPNATIIIMISCVHCVVHHVLSFVRNHTCHIIIYLSYLSYVYAAFGVDRNSPMNTLGQRFGYTPQMSRLLFVGRDVLEMWVRGSAPRRWLVLRPRCGLLPGCRSPLCRCIGSRTSCWIFTPAL